jgi:hypothetical protein
MYTETNQNCGDNIQLRDDLQISQQKGRFNRPPLYQPLILTNTDCLTEGLRKDIEVFLPISGPGPVVVVGL